MTLGTILLTMGATAEIIEAIGDILDLDTEVTQEMLADAEARVAAKRDEWDSLG